MSKEKPQIPEAAGRIHGILDEVEELGLSPYMKRKLDRVRDQVNALTSESRPYFSPLEEGARIDLFEMLQCWPDQDKEYTNGMTAAEAIKHLDKRTEQGLALTRAHIQLMRAC